MASGIDAGAQSSAIGFAQKNSATPQAASATVNVKYSAAQTVGDLNVVVVGWNDTTSTVQSVKDSAGNVYSLAIGPTSGTALRQSIYYAANIAGVSSNTVTVTFSQAAAYPDVRILEYRGVTAVDVTAGASGSSTSANSGAATTRSPNELVFGANTVATATNAAGSGFTSRVITTPDGDIAEDKIVTTAGSNSTKATLASSGPWVMQMVTFGTVAVTATPQISASAGSLSFGSVTVNSSGTQSLTLTSSGTAPVTVSSASVSGTGFSLVGGTLPATLSPNQTLTLQVKFAPTATGSAAGSLTISSNSASGSTRTVSLSGTGATTTPQLSFSATSLSFGSVTVNSSATKSLTLTSTGTSPVTVNSAAITGAGFTIVSGSLPVTLNPTQSVTLQVQFLPTATGSASGQITISSNSSTGGTTAVTLGGTGTAATNPQLTVGATSLSFGSVTVNTATTQSLTLTSSGTSPVTVSSAAITGTGFTIVAASFPVTLSPTQSVTLQVQFDPTATGTASGQIAINSNSSKGSTASVALSGTGTAANPQLTVSAGSLSFGSVTVNTATTASLTLTSTGTTPVTANSATITGAGFTIIGGSFPTTLNPNQTATLKLQFEPTTAGALTGQLSISSNSTSGSTATVSLTGTGTAVAHQVDLTWDAPSGSSDPVAGYNIYRATGSGSFTRINSSADTAVSYVDSNVVSGTSYSYQVTSSDPSGQESVPTSPVTVTIP
ncbi:choice-of-anchor D domain-containing protein [Tunturibacter psychrotolerans]|uniref:Choice-of-anchor D domain-containing protein n=1 Tax=Tunturiibacter psychrotolerans TaxID=3069686 RepID=A0AAU7ZNG1_9BACT